MKKTTNTKNYESDQISISFFDPSSPGKRQKNIKLNTKNKKPITKSISIVNSMDETNEKC